MKSRQKNDTGTAYLDTDSGVLVIAQRHKLSQIQSNVPDPLVEAESTTNQQGKLPPPGILRRS